MTPDDMTQPYTQRPTQPPNWPAHESPTTPWRAIRQPRGRAGCLWGAGGFVLGIVLAALIALAALAPAPAPSVAAQPKGAALAVTLTDTVLTQAIASNVQAGTGSLAQARAHIQANSEVVITGKLAGLSGAGTTVTIVTQPYVSDHTLAVRVLRVGYGGLALPTALLDAMRDQINASLARSSQVSLGVGETLAVSGVSFSNGSMTVTYEPVHS
ncbi:MAG TPA: hypothetical protein VF739_16075 [Ktedonobacterales bacterium]